MTEGRNPKTPLTKAGPGYARDYAVEGLRCLVRPISTKNFDRLRCCSAVDIDWLILRKGI